MTCPDVDELLAGGATSHAEACASCRAVLELAFAHSSASAICRRVDGLLAARALGRLAPSDAAGLDAHVRACAVCRGLAEDLDPAAIADLDGRELVEIARDRYVIGAEIGRGGMGRIVRARDVRLGRDVAIKELIDGRMRARFEDEARLTARLSHPAIVGVHEAGRWPDGAPFYAMEYVAGQPLDRAIAAAATLDERLGLLHHVIATVDAIAYAHSERVIHRDLKPHNILVGRFGETVVIDWGLARELGAAGGGGAERPAAGALTAAGAGTEAYMPPEQARGDAPDERADVYALGATLHHLLAGGRPDLRALPDDTPFELRAIVAKAMAPDRRDRYPTAAELARELRRFQSGQLVGAHRYRTAALVRRWVRRHRTAVTLSAAFAAAIIVVAAVGLAGIVAARGRAEAAAVDAAAERDDARRARDAAEGLAEGILGELHRDLAAAGKVHLLANTADAVLRYHDASGGTRHAEDPRGLGTLAAALDVLGDVAHERSDAGTALALARMQVDVLARAPAGRVPLAAMTEAYHRLADASRDAGALLGPTGALAAATTAVALAAVAGPGQQRLFARGLGELGQIATDALGDPALARGLLAEQCALYERMATERPEDEALLRDLGQCQQALFVANRFGDLGQQIEVAARSQALYQRLAARHPDDLPLEFDLSTAEFFLASTKLWVGDVDGARAGLTSCTERRRRLAAFDPQNVRWQQNLGFCLQALGAAELAAARPEEALRWFGEHLEHAEALVRAHPEDWTLRRDLVQPLEAQCRAYLDAGKTRAALESCRRATVVLDEIAATRSDVAETLRLHRVQPMISLAEVELAAGDLGAAGRLAAEVLAIAGVRADPGALNYRALAHWVQGRVALARGDLPAAVAALASATDGLRSLHEMQPIVSELAGHFAAAAIDLGGARARRHDPAAAAAFREAVAALEPFEARRCLPAREARLLARARRELP